LIYSSVVIISTEELSLNSKLVLYKADSAMAIRNNQLKVSKDLIDLLNKDLKTAKRKAFWNNFKGVAIGIAAGVTVGILAK
jgi:hypothetical protein